MDTILMKELKEMTMDEEQRTMRLFWTSPEQEEFEGVVIQADRDERGWAVVLDRTAFFPESGGQPADVGELDGHPVADVQEKGAAIVHHVSGGSFENGAAVQGKVDMARRRDHSTQHTAQHVISAIVKEKLGAKTIGFHLGRDKTTVDFDLENIDERQLLEIEMAANQVVIDNLPITVSYTRAPEQSPFRTQREIAPGEPLRLVSIGELVQSACCGTHLSATGQVRIIKLGRTERVHRSVRLEFFAGSRVIDELGRLQNLASGLSRLTSSGPDELLAVFKAGNEEQKALRRENDELRRVWAQFEAAKLVQEASPVAACKMVSKILEPMELKHLKLIAVACASHPGVVALLGSVWQEKPSLVFARSDDVAADMSALLKTALAAIGGKGGGKSDLAQGGGGDPEKLSAALAAAADQLN